MSVNTDVSLLVENPEIKDDWAGYPDTVARKSGEPVRCRLLYHYETEETGLFIQMSLELLFADEQGCISHFRPVRLPEGMSYSTARTEEGYHLRFVLGNALPSCPNGELEFMIESTAAGLPDGVTVPTAVTLSGMFRGEDHEEILSMEKPGPVWLVLRGSEAFDERMPVVRDLRLETYPKIVKLAPPGDFWQPSAYAGSKDPEMSPYTTIRVASRAKPRTFYW